MQGGGRFGVGGVRKVAGGELAGVGVRSTCKREGSSPGRSRRPGCSAAGRGPGRLRHKSLRVPSCCSSSRPPPAPRAPPRAASAPPPVSAWRLQRAERAEQGRGRATEYADERLTDSSAFQCPSETRALLPQLLTPDSRLPQTPTAGLARGCAHRLRAAAAAAAAPLPRPAGRPG